MNKAQNFLKGIFSENPVFVLLLGMCPVLGVTSTLFGAIGMGVAFTIVLVLSNIIVSLIKNFIPDEVRIPAYIVVIATLVTIVQLVMQGFLPSLYDQLGIFIPLIVVNCVILGRAEAYASKNNVGNSIIDALGMGVGYTIAIVVLAFFRELLGDGALTLFIYGDINLKLNLIPNNAFEPMSILTLAPGAFITLGFLLAIINAIFKNDKETKKQKTAKA
ncbi:electron transport complex subunit E [Mycoplasmatota bacterium]|nr:electron transport complex subunit E [Mycoplasmatota bacterium]